MMVSLLMRKVIRVVPILLTLSTADASGLVWAQLALTEVVGRFSASTVGSVLPERWKPLTLRKVPAQTKYEVITDAVSRWSRPSARPRLRACPKLLESI